MKVIFEITESASLLKPEPVINASQWFQDILFFCKGKTKIIFPHHIFEDDLEVLLRAMEILQSIRNIKVAEDENVFFNFQFEFPFKVSKRGGVYSFFEQCDEKELLENVDEDCLDQVVQDVEGFINSDVRVLNNKVADFLISGKAPFQSDSSKC